MEDTVYGYMLKLSILSLNQQQRALKKLEKFARQYSKEKQNNAPSGEADLYAYQRRVVLSRQARANHLVRCFFRGVPYIKAEEKNKESTLSPMVVISDYMPYDNVLNEVYVDLVKWVEGR